MIITKENLHKYIDSLGYSIEELEGMKIGDSYEISTTINKIKRTALDEWLFLRFDSVNTHIHKEYPSNQNNKELWDNFKKSCDYALKYGEDRNNAIKENFNDDHAAEIVSTVTFMNEQVKTTSAQLSGESGITKTLEKIADYIVFSKFNNVKEEEQHEDVKKEIMRLERIKKKKRKEAEQKRIEEAKLELKNTPYNHTKKLSVPPSHMNLTSLSQIHDGTIDERSVGTHVNYTRVDRQMEQGKFNEDMEAFRERFSPSKPNSIPHYAKEPINYKELAYSTMKQYIDEIEYLESRPFSPDRAKQISYLKTEMRTALETLRKVIHIQPTSSIDETIPMDSWNRLSLRNTDTYIALLLGYYDATKKYDNKPSTSFWALLRTFEQILNNTIWTNEEKVLIEFILETGITDQKQIAYELEKETGSIISQSQISKLINKHIPNKLLHTYEKQLEDWIWTYRRKGLYKTCKHCNEVKLAVDNRYFSKDTKGIYGLKAKCKTCEKKK